MKILISPAKLLNYDQPTASPFHSQAQFIDEADYLAKKLQKISKKELKELMKISENLIDVNYQRYQDWEKPNKLSDKIRPAVTVFNGEVYKGLDVATFSEKDFKNAQDNLRILSGLYGILKPMDLMYPYRLEMGTKWQINATTKDLYQFWGNQISTFLNNEMKKDEVIINLSSNEYFKSVNKKMLKARVITPVFKELKGDHFKVIVVYTKHARGAMARNIIQNQYKTVDDLKGYDIDGYSYSESMSKGNEWVFIRG